MFGSFLSSSGHGSLRDFVDVGEVAQGNFLCALSRLEREGVGRYPPDYPRGHEANVAVTAAATAIKQCGWKVPVNPRERPADGGWLALHAIERALRSVQVIWPIDTPTEQLTVVRAGRVALPPPRDCEEFEPREDWLKSYAPQYRRILNQHGVPAVANSAADIFNRHLIKVLPADCTDEGAIKTAKEDAFHRAFGFDFAAELAAEEDYIDTTEVELHDQAYTQIDLDDVCWETYPEEHRALLKSFGRLDYEHPDAAAFNRALIAATSLLRDRGLDDQATLGDLRRSLWRQFFPDEPYQAP
jgi:hypothetical protein